MKSSSDLSVESAIRSEGLGWSARSGSRLTRELYFQPECATYVTGSVNASWGTPRLRSCRLVRGTCMCVFRKDAPRTKYKPGLKPAWKALGQPDLLRSPVIIIIKSTLRAVRALVKECFISPRLVPAPGPPFRRPSGYATYGETTLASPLGHSLLRFTLRPTRSILSIPRDLTLRPHRQR